MPGWHTGQAPCKAYSMRTSLKQNKSGYLISLLWFEYHIWNLLSVAGGGHARLYMAPAQSTSPLKTTKSSSLRWKRQEGERGVEHGWFIFPFSTKVVRRVSRAYGRLTRFRQSHFWHSIKNLVSPIYHPRISSNNFLHISFSYIFSIMGHRNFQRRWNSMGIFCSPLLLKCEDVDEISVVFAKCKVMSHCQIFAS